MKKIYYLISIMAVVLGFSGVNVVTNSFADECIGKRSPGGVAALRLGGGWSVAIHCKNSRDSRLMLQCDMVSGDGEGYKKTKPGCLIAQGYPGITKQI